MKKAKSNKARSAAKKNPAKKKPAKKQEVSGRSRGTGKKAGAQPLAPQKRAIPRAETTVPRDDT
jgi:hypothetical protein